MKITLQQFIMLVDILTDSLMVPDRAPIFKLNQESRADLLGKLHETASKQEVEIELPGKERVAAIKAGIILER